MGIKPQFTYDNQGNPLGVFLTIEDWNHIAANIGYHANIDEREKRMILAGLKEYQDNQERLVAWDSIKAELDQEDAAL